MDITHASLDLIFKGLDYSFAENYLKAPTFWKQIASEVPSSTESNIYPFLNMIPGFREWIGERVKNNVTSNSYTLVNKHWENTISIDRNRVEDDQYGIYSPVAAMLAVEAAEFRDVELARIIEAGTTELGWDGQFFFDTDHPVNPYNAGAGTNSNKLVGSSYDIAAADPLAPFALARAAMRTWKRADGRRSGAMGNVLMVHPNDEKFALQIANAINTPMVFGSNTAATAVSNVYQGSVEVLVNPYLEVTSGKPWYLLCTSMPLKPFLWQNRREVQTVQLTDISNPNVFLQREFLWGADLRGAAGYSFPFLAFRMSAS